MKVPNNLLDNLRRLKAASIYLPPECENMLTTGECEGPIELASARAVIAKHMQNLREKNDAQDFMSAIRQAKKELERRHGAPNTQRPNNQPEPVNDEQNDGGTNEEGDGGNSEPDSLELALECWEENGCFVTGEEYATNE